LDKSNGNIISNNNCLNNQEGISLDESNGNIIANNNCSNNDRGIELLESLNNCIRQNNATSNSYGIYIGCAIISRHTIAGVLISGTAAIQPEATIGMTTWAAMFIADQTKTYQAAMTLATLLTS
jgi:parallel beta-helix repeat protein